jgi:hypothetical protein
MYVYLGIPNPIYPDYYLKTFTFITEYKPLILSADPSLVPSNYCQQGKASAIDGVLVFIPCK